METRQISEQRKALYRIGQIMMAIGLLSFMSVFVSAALHFGDFSDFNGQVRSIGLRAVGGMFLMIAGGAVMSLGAAGAAGSGLNLDPEQARQDLEPWARMSGGLQKASLDEMGIDVPKIADAITTGLSGGAQGGGESLEERLRGLHALHKDGILTEAEYLREKQELLDRR
jgi:hypothetical protein